MNKDKTNEELYKDLEIYQHFDQDESYAEKFLDIVDELVLRQDPDCMPVLFQYFDDNSEYSWVLESMLVALGHLPDEGYVKNFLINLSSGTLKALGWFCEMFYGIMNHSICLDLFRSNICLADKGSLLKLFDAIEQESPHRHELIQELRQEVVKRREE